MMFLDWFFLVGSTSRIGWKSEGGEWGIDSGLWLPVTPTKTNTQIPSEFPMDLKF
jgi:hypothetical protein